MATKTRCDRLLPANSKAIQKAVKASPGRAVEYRIDGARGLVLHVLPSGTATWYFHYDAELGKRRERRKLKIGRLDEVTLARALGEASDLQLAALPPLTEFSIVVEIPSGRAARQHM